MKPIKVNFVITPEMVVAIVKIFILLGAIGGTGYGANKVIIQPIVKSVTEYKEKFVDCNVTLLNATTELNDTKINLTDCFEVREDLKTNFTLYKNKYDICNSNLNSKSGSVIDLTEQLSKCNADLVICISQKDSYKSSWDKCKRDLKDCEATC